MGKNLLIHSEAYPFFSLGYPLLKPKAGCIILKFAFHGNGRFRLFKTKGL